AFSAACFVPAPDRIPSAKSAILPNFTEVFGVRWQSEAATPLWISFFDRIHKIHKKRRVRANSARDRLHADGSNLDLYSVNLVNPVYWVVCTGRLTQSAVAASLCRRTPKSYFAFFTTLSVSSSTSKVLS